MARTLVRAVATPDELIERVEFLRLDASRQLNSSQQAELGQFFTPASVARLMASLFGAQSSDLSLLDAGAGVGSLSAAFVSEMCQRKKYPRQIEVTAYEVDSSLTDYLEDTFRLCRAVCQAHRIAFRSTILTEDFIATGAEMLAGGLFATASRQFNCIIMNPPYRKIHSQSRTRSLMRRLGIETGNLYTCFLSVAVRLLEPEGELVAITPRSFCNGPYFRAFREWFLRTVALQRIHVFDRRDHAFQDDDVLQENIIFRVVNQAGLRQSVTISTGGGLEDDHFTLKETPFEQVVRPDDPEAFIHLVPDEVGRSVTQRLSLLTSSLADLGVSVSTGRVVDFRAISFLRDKPAESTVPLIYPVHLDSGWVVWPKERVKKPNYIVAWPESEDLLVPEGIYVLVKRFSAKEERRRVVAAVFDPTLVATPKVGFENHLNYYHRNGNGLTMELAKGLSAYLNSTLLDLYFRQFSGHTQVNATDLRNLPYPSREQLERLGSRIGQSFPDQDSLDRLIEEVLFPMADDDSSPNPIAIKKRIDEALSILKLLGLPREQQNERSALTLLALLDLWPETPWSQASDPLRGITPMMNYFEAHYGKQYAPNTRETVRRQTVHQFLQAGLIVANPDQPIRETNSPKTVYQIESSALELLRLFGTPKWNMKLEEYLATVKTLAKQYARAREMKRIPLKLNSSTVITLSPGDHNILTNRVVTEFCPRFTPGG